jgi:hypothetical protein
MTIEHPDHGGRVRLELRDEEERAALYAVTLFIVGGRWDSVARVDLRDGVQTPQCGEWTASDGATGEAPAWLARYASSMLAVLQRDHRQAPVARWPRRILRWRAERA